METPQGIGENIARWRKRRQLSVRQLATRLEEIDHKILPSGITKIELGNRNVGINDLLAFALALEVPPAILLWPADRTLSVDVLGREVTPLRATRWFAGRQTLEDNSPGFAAGSAALALDEVHERAQEAYGAVLNEWHMWEAGMFPAVPGDDDRPNIELQRERRHALTQLRLTRSEMRRHGFPVPELPDEMAHVDDREFTFMTDGELGYYVQTPDEDKQSS